MAFREVDFLLVGGGLASATAAETLRIEGAEGSILILSNEGVAPYHKPPLSKGYLSGTNGVAQLFVHPEHFYRDQAVELQLNSQAIAVDPAQRSVTSTEGDQFKYGQLLIATGMVPRQLSVPGVELAGVYTLRRKSDCEAIRNAGAHAKQAVVVGASFLGMEVAVSLTRLGLGVTVIERGGSVMPTLEAPDVCEYFRQYVEKLGIAVLLNDTVAAIRGENKVQSLETSSGRSLPCDLVVVCIGVTPATEFLNGSGLSLDNGLIVVDDLLRTNAPNVFAAGDATRFYDPVFARRRHIEHWDNAIKQGQLAAKNMLGRQLRYDEVSYFFCDIGDLSFDVLGATDAAEERIGRGALETHSFALFYLEENIPRALFSLGRPADETRIGEGLIRYRVNLLKVKDRLQDPSFKLDEISMQTVLVLQGGGALGAFECGVVKALEEEQVFPDVVAGVSIGALNGAIIAGNPRHATAALEAFWADLSVATPDLLFRSARQASALPNILTFGVPKFFRPRWMQPVLTPADLPSSWTSFYDPSPMKELIAKYVDFSALKKSPVRLLVGAVEVRTAKLQIFDSYVDDLTPDHIMASGSLPPGFPWTVVDGKAYWDGGIVSNSPLDFVIDRCGAEGKRVYIVDLFTGQKPLPTNMLEVVARYEEIIYSERIRNDLRNRETVVAYRNLVEEILSDVEPAALAKIKQRPRYIQLIGDSVPTTITRFVRADRSDEPSWRDFDFSDSSIRLNKSEGYALAKKTLTREQGSQTKSDSKNSSKSGSN